MKKLLCVFGVIAGMLASSGANATLFNYSYTFEFGGSISGSFEGTANGNLITNLNHITASMNGTVFNGSGNLFGSHFDTQHGSWASGGAVASFDGLENNFLFIDSDYPNKPNFTNFFYAAIFSPQHGGVTDDAYAYMSSTNQGAFDSYSNMTYNWRPANWSVSAANAVPEPASLALAGLGLAGLGFTRRRKAAKAS